MKKNNNHGGLNTSAMPSKLSTLVSKISAIPNYDNVKIIDEFYRYMKENGASEKHITNELQTVLYYATFLGPHTCLLDINKREQILTFLNTKQKQEDIDPSNRWITTWNDYLGTIKHFFRWFYSQRGKEELVPPSEWETPQFQREYNLEYIGEQGNVFSHESIEHAIIMGLELEALPNYYASYVGIRPDLEKSMGVDAGFGSSKFGIVVTQLVPENKSKNVEQAIQVVYAEEFERPDFNDMLNLILKIHRNYHVSKIFVDAANPEIITSIKTGVGDRPDYERQIANLKQKHSKYLNLATFMNVIPDWMEKVSEEQYHRP